MRIGLLDIDGHNFPNLALMKLSASHKEHGDTTELFRSGETYDRVYTAKVFDFTPDYKGEIRADQILQGGTGHQEPSELPPEIEHRFPDYGLYNITDRAFGFLTRGCPRACGHCIVSDKEGRKSIKVADLEEFWSGQKAIDLLDPNLLACKDREDLLKQIAASGAWINFNSGLDIRFTDETVIHYLKQIKINTIHFAWDGLEDLEPYFQRVKDRTGFPPRKLAAYVLTNYNTTWAWDLHRVNTLRRIGYEPFVMIYNKQDLPHRHPLKSLQRWTANKRGGFWRKYATFDAFQAGVYKNPLEVPR